MANSRPAFRVGQDKDRYGHGQRVDDMHFGTVGMKLPHLLFVTIRVVFWRNIQGHLLPT